MRRNDAADIGDGLTAGLTALAKELDGTVVQHGEVTGVFTGLPIPDFNPIHCWRHTPELATDLARVVEEADAAGLAVKIVVPVGSIQETTVAEVARQHGFVPDEETAPGMVLGPATAPPLPDGLSCSTPLGAEGAAAVAEVMADAFDMPMEFSRMLSTEQILQAPGTEWVLLSKDDIHVATAMLAVAGDVAAVFNVGVPKAFRRQGFGAAATWEVIRRGAELGLAVTALESSELGEPVYRNMGFELVSRNRSFRREAG